MPKLDPLPTPFISPGEPITARALDQLARVASRQSPAVGGFVNGAFSLHSPVTSKGGSTVIQGGSSSPPRLVLIDEDIPGITEADPQDFLTASDIDLPEGWSVKFQHPPDDDLTENWVEDNRLNLHRYRRLKLRLRVYEGSAVTGTAQTYSGGDDEIKLAAGASGEEGFYNGDSITITAGTGSGQSKTITAYNGTSKVAMVDSPWTTGEEPDNTSEYAIVSSADMALATETVDDEANDRRIVRYKYINVWYDDAKPFLVGTYQRSDYPEIGENEPDPEGGFPTRKYRGLVIGGVLFTILCWPLPAPELPD